MLKNPKESKCSFTILMASSIAMISLPADGALLSRLDGQAVYDTDLNITVIKREPGGSADLWRTLDRTERANAGCHR